MRVLTPETTTHGRVLIEDAAVAVSPTAPAPLHGLIVAFHGYGQAAEDMLGQLRLVPGIGRWRVAAVQALHRFYTRNDERVVASWMTRQDRELAIADNLAYVDRAVAAAAAPGAVPARLVFVGFSQGVAMAYRAALLGAHAAAGVIALGGDIPPDLKEAATAPDKDATGRTWPPVIIGAGTREQWYSVDKVQRDLAFLEAAGVPHEFVRFEGGHEWTDDFRARVGVFLGTGLAGDGSW